MPQGTEGLLQVVKERAHSTVLSSKLEGACHTASSGSVVPVCKQLFRETLSFSPPTSSYSLFIYSINSIEWLILPQSL
jgi:hypothetical protein